MRIYPDLTQDEEFQKLRSQGYTGSLNDMQFPYLGNLGSEGSLTDRFSNTDFIFQLFENNEIGAWFNDTPDNRYTTSTGETKANTGDPVGLILDKSKEFALGPELVTNGGFDTGNMTGWTVGVDATATVVNGKAEITSTISTDNIVRQSMSVEVGKWYRLTFAASGPVGSSVRLGHTSGGTEYANITPSTIETTYTRHILATNTTLFISLVPDTSGTAKLIVDGFTNKHLAGYHASQSTPASRPTAQPDHLAHDLDDVLTVTLPNLGSDATLAYSDESNIHILTGQTISGNTNLPAVAKLGPVIYYDRPFTLAETSRVEDYLERRRPV